MQSLACWAASKMARAARSARGLCSAMIVTAMAVAGLSALSPAVQAGALTAGRVSHRPASVRGDEDTASQDDLRTGWDPNEPGLSPAVVGGGTFGQVFSTAVKGQVYGQPLVIGSTVIVATENDWVYALNATTGAILWSKSLGAPWPITSCTDLTPNIGVTSTPVYDPTTGAVYVMALIKGTTVAFHLFGLKLSNGTTVLNRTISGHPSNDSHITFQAKPQDQRTALLLNNGWVYAGFASHCDHKPYAGYVAAVDVQAKPVTSTLWTDEAGVSDDQAGIWQSGGGLMSDGPGRIFFTSGNGISPAAGPGDAPPGQLAESVVRLAPQANGTLAAQDFFSPSNAPTLDAGDRDFGAGGPVGLPFGTATYPDLLVQAGKDGRIFVLNRDNLGGRKQGAGGTDNDLLLAGPYGGQWGHPAIFADTPTLTTANAATSNDYMYYVGKSDYLRALRFGDSSTDTPTLTDAGNSTFTFGFSSGSPVVTSNGTDPASAVVWVVDTAGATGKNATLTAFDAIPQPATGGGTQMTEIWSAPIGTASKFMIPASDNGMVYVGTRDGHVIGFGVTTAGALKRGKTVTFRDTSLGSSSATHVSVTATRRVTVSRDAVAGSASPDPFTLGRVTLTRGGSGKAVAVKFPVRLHKGDALHVAAAFRPTVIGGATGEVSFITGTGPSGRISVPLVGDGTRGGLFATEPELAFAVNTNDGEKITNVPVGITAALVTDIVNGGTTPVKVTRVKLPAGPYTVSGMPRTGSVIKPGEAVPVQVVYAPQQTVTSKDSFTITGSSGTSATVHLVGTGIKPVTKFTASPSVVHFGSVKVGHTATVWIHVVNVGNQPSLMRKTALPNTPFGAPLTVVNGLPVNGGYDLSLPVTFHPTRKGAFTGNYTLRWTDRFGSHALSVRVTGTGT
jgi:outer membrane protein assembly factor BamB